MTIVGLLAVWGVPAFGAVLMAVGVVLVVIGACDPKREVARKAEEARAKVEAAGDLCDQQRYAEAIPLLEEAKQLVPDVSAIYYLLGHALSGAERFTEAVTWLEEAQERGATDTPLPVVLGYTYYKAGQIEKGMEMLQAIPDDHPLFVTAISLLAGMFEERGQCETAIEVLKRAPLQKRNLTEELLQVHYVLGSYYLRLGDKKSALRHFRRVYAHSMDYRDVKAQIEALSGKL